MDTIDEIPMGHKADLAYLFRMGVIGWQAEARNNYMNYSQLHNLQQVLIQVNSKNYKAKKPAEFKSLFPEHEEMARLGKEKATDLHSRFKFAMDVLGKKKNAT